MAVLCRMNTIQYSAKSVLHKLHSTLPSVTCLQLSDVSVICRVTYFQFPIQSAFLPCLSAKQHSGILVYLTSDIGHCRKFG